MGGFWRKATINASFRRYWESSWVLPWIFLTLPPAASAAPPSPPQRHSSSMRAGMRSGRGY